MPAVRRSLRLAVLLVAAAWIAGCSKEPEGAIKVAAIGTSLDLAESPDGTLDPPQALLLTNLAQGLVRFDANGQIVPGLAERWNVTDDGLSYIFRLEGAEWPDGQKISAYQVARILRRQIASRSRNPLRDLLGAIEEIVAMTDRVLEIRLRAPRPNLLQILAQPEFAVARDGGGAGPFRIGDKDGDAIRLVRALDNDDPESDEDGRREQVVVYARSAADAVRLFAAGRIDLVVGGTFDNLPVTTIVQLPRDALRFDPAGGLFGLVPARADGPLDDVEFRRLLTQAVDREALIAALSVPGLLPRTTVLDPGLDGVVPGEAPDWASVPIAERKAGLKAAADSYFGDRKRPVLRVALPGGPGSELLLNQLASDWAILGVGVERASGNAADLRLIDSVAPSISPAWYLRQFRCVEVPICDEDADRLIEASRAAPVAPQRAALLAEASRLVDQAQLFLPLAAPIRWSLVADRVQGWAPNRFARHTLTSLDQKVERGRAD